MAEVVERKFKGDKVASSKVLRDGNRAHCYDSADALRGRFPCKRNAYNEKPRFVVFGGLVFQPVDANFMSEHNPDDLRLHFLF